MCLYQDGTKRKREREKTVSDETKVLIRELRNEWTVILSLSRTLSVFNHLPLHYSPSLSLSVPPSLSHSLWPSSSPVLPLRFCHFLSRDSHYTSHYTTTTPPSTPTVQYTTRTITPSTTPRCLLSLYLISFYLISCYHFLCHVIDASVLSVLILSIQPHRHGFDAIGFDFVSPSNQI